MTASYLALVRQRPARRLIYALSAGGLAFGMVSLTVLLTVERTTGSYRTGGFSVASFALMAGLSAPFRGRLIDRRGAWPWLPVLALAYAGWLVALDVAAHASAPGWLLIALGGGIGINAPPLFASGRAVWPQAVGPELLRHGYAMTSLLLDTGLVAGPALASGLFLVSAWIAPIACGTLAATSAFLSISTRHPDRFVHAPTPMPRLRESRALVGLLLISIVHGASQGLVQVAVPVAAGHWHHKALAGPLLASFAVGSVVGALWFGSRGWKAAVVDRYLRAVFLLGILLAPVALAQGPLLLAPLLFVAGLAFGPATVALFEALDIIIPGGGAEALTWITTADAAGAAGGSAISGALANHVGVGVPFWIASAIVALPTGAVLLLRHRSR